MVDEFLNQDEIDALLTGDDGGGGGSLSEEDKVALTEVVNIIAGAANNVIGMLAGRDVSANNGEQEAIAQNETINKVSTDGKVFAYSLTLSGLDAPAQLLTTERGALALADLMMGGDAKDLPEEANDLYLSASQEGLSQVIGSALTSLSGLLSGLKLSADNATASLESDASWVPFSSDPGDAQIWLGPIELTVEGVDPFSLDLAMPLAAALDLAARVREAMKPEEEEAPEPPAAAAPQPAAAPAGGGAPAAPAAPPMGGGGGFSMPARPQGPPVDARPVEFAQLGGGDFSGLPSNIDLIMDIPVRVTVELGRTRKTIGEVLALGPGQVVELSRMAGEPVDVLVNGKLIARGEVVVIDESFGVRISEVVSKTERIRSMGV